MQRAVTGAAPVVAPPRYDLLDEPWIPCIDPRGEPVELGLIETLERAHELIEVRDPSPLVTYGINRLLLAIVQDRLKPETKPDWLDHLRRGRVEQDVLQAIRREDGDRFDLFHEKHPFYQSGDLPLVPTAQERKTLKPKTVGYLRDEVPTGTNVNHFHHAYDDRQAYCPSCAARGLVTHPPFAYSGGRPYTPSINGAPPVYVWITGETLARSLCWNLALPHYRPEQARRDDRPAWRGDGVIRPKESRAEVGYVESLTWQPRRLRLIPSDGGTCTLCRRDADVLIREIVRDQGWSRPDGAAWWRDPFVAYRMAQGGEKNPPKAIQPREDRATWRDFAVLFLPGTDDATRVPARIVEQAVELAPEPERLGVDSPSVQCFALRTDKAKLFEWRHERFPFTARIAGDPERTVTLEKALGLAEKAADLLRNAVRNLYPRTGEGNPKAFGGLIRHAQGAFWAELAPIFRHLVIRLDRPETDIDLDDLVVRWKEDVKRVALDAFDQIADGFDTDADALRRVVASRRQFLSILNRLLS